MAGANRAAFDASGRAFWLFGMPDGDNEWKIDSNDFAVENNGTLVEINTKMVAVNKKPLQTWNVHPEPGAEEKLER